jgi:phosphoribosyl-AMP cyclohydrolase / phosphoribosyl-ATP pyrophosphohydrolase
MRDRDAPLSGDAIGALAWDKMDGLLPAVVQDEAAGTVLMLGYMNREALAETLASGRVTFWSRSKQRLWTKGESSGHFLALRSVHADCDDDALLVRATPHGPTCHLGTESCFGVQDLPGPAWLAKLSAIVAERASTGDPASYTARLLAEGLPKIAQKVGEEGVEVALAAVTRDSAGLAEESADLLYHLIVLMQARGVSWPDIVAVLRRRHGEAPVAPR